MRRIYSNWPQIRFALSRTRASWLAISGLFSDGITPMYEPDCPLTLPSPPMGARGSSSDGLWLGRGIDSSI
jgi:hypothetical protein